METTTFTISKGEHGYDIKSKKYKANNYYNVPADKLFTAMTIMADAFNNVYGIAVVFEVE